jgi:hypothetical protein
VAAAPNEPTPQSSGTVVGDNGHVPRLPINANPAMAGVRVVINR